MRTIKAVIILLLFSAVTGGLQLAGAGKSLKNPGAPIPQQETNQPDLNNISQYYGFGEIEIVKLDYGIQCLQVADFDGDGRNDIAVANNRKAGIELLLQKPQVGLEEEEVAVDPNDLDINALVGPGRFKRQIIPVSQGIYSMVCGDLNSDRLIDLAFYGEPKGVYVLLRKPKQEKTSNPKDLGWQPRKRINIDDALPNKNALVCADIDNDGRKDLIAASRNAIYIILQKEDGSLAEPVKYAVAAQVLGIDTGDLNGDGKTDLVIYTDERERPIHVRLGQKTNQLGPEIRLFAEYPVSAEPANIDGKAGDELVMIDSIGRRLVCYSFAASPGVSKSTKDQGNDDWPVLFYPLPSGQGSEKRDLVIGDVDGDGLSDIVISDPASAELVLYRQAAGVGLAEPMKFPALAESDVLSIADIDGDGKNEVAVLSVKEKVIGISRFDGQRLSFPKAVDLRGEPLAMELTDIDGDGSVDCAYIARSQADARSFRVIYNVSKPQAQADVNSPDGPEVELQRLAANPDGIKILDVDRDGLKDVLVFVKYELPILIRQVEKRKFEVVDSPGAQASLLKDASVRSIYEQDIAPGIPGRELLIAQNNFARSMTFENGGWKIIDQYNAKSEENRISAVCAAKLEGVGEDSPVILLLDGLKGRLQVLKAGEDKTYRFDKELDVGTWSASRGIKMELVSLMGQRDSRHKEILLFDGEKFAIVLPPDGAIRAKLDQKFSYETKIKDGAYGNLTTGDINSDGLPEIIMVEYKHNHIEILALDSTGQPVPAMRFKIFEDKAYRESRELPPGIGGSVEPRELKVADVTGDGKADLVTVIHDRIIVYPQD